MDHTTSEVRTDSSLGYLDIPIASQERTIARSAGGAQVCSFPENDPESPNNWPLGAKLFTMSVGLLSTFNGVLGSSLASGATDSLAIHFGASSSVDAVIPQTVYQLGFVVGSLIFAPLSELYGRKIIFLLTTILYGVFNLASALAPTWPAFVFFRWVCGVAAASTISVTAGLNADLFDDPLSRGRANALFLAITTMGPQFGPLVGGYASKVGWQWPFWIALIVSVLVVLLLFMVQETYGPVILQRRVKRRRSTNPNILVYTPIELEKQGLREIMLVFIVRPLHMIVAELMITLTCLYLSFTTGIYYLFFQAYPFIFQDVFGLGIGLTGVAFLPVALGAFFGLLLSFRWDTIFRKASIELATWAQNEDYRRLPMACIGGPCCVVALFWLGWTSSTSIHWTVPMFAGIPFGLGFFFILVALNNYLADAYKTYSASALAAVSASRSLGAAVLPFAAAPLYQSLGIAWASSLLGLISLAMVVIPFAFIVYGEPIRRRSRFSQVAT